MSLNRGNTASSRALGGLPAWQYARHTVVELPALPAWQGDVASLPQGLAMGQCGPLVIMQASHCQ